MERDVAKVFASEGGQAIRLPDNIRFAETELCVRRVGRAVLIYPRAEAWALHDRAVAAFGGDFPEREQPTEQPRDVEW